MGNEEEYRKLTEEASERELLRRQQALRIAKLGLLRVAKQLHYWDQYCCGPEDLDMTRTGIDD